jgi:hypothetical protein
VTASLPPQTLKLKNNDMIQLKFNSHFVEMQPIYRYNEDGKRTTSGSKRKFRIEHKKGSIKLYSDNHPLALQLIKEGMVTVVRIIPDPFRDAPLSPTDLKPEQEDIRSNKSFKSKKNNK